MDSFYCIKSRLAFKFIGELPMGEVADDISAKVSLVSKINAALTIDAFSFLVFFPVWEELSFSRQRKLSSEIALPCRPQKYSLYRRRRPSKLMVPELQSSDRLSVPKPHKPAALQHLTLETEGDLHTRDLLNSINRFALLAERHPPNFDDKYHYGLLLQELAAKLRYDLEMQTRVMPKTHVIELLMLVRDCSSDVTFVE